MNSEVQPAGMKRREFVAFIAAVMAVNALGVDLMLPALADIGRELSVGAANHRQWIITAYMLGFGAGQLVYGPLADRYGRKPILVVTLAGFVAASIFAAGSPTFEALLGARVLQGLMSASTRVLAVAIVRDGQSGRQMARTLSLAQMIFFWCRSSPPAWGRFCWNSARGASSSTLWPVSRRWCSPGRAFAWPRHCRRRGAFRCRSPR